MEEIDLDNYKDRALKLVETKYDEVKLIKKKLVSMLKENTSERKLNICLFGTGLVGKGFHNDLGNMGIKIKYFCDNDSTKWGKVIKGDAICLSPSELSERYVKENLLVIITVGAVNEVYPQLIEMGITKIIKHPFDLLAEPQNKWTTVDKNDILLGIEKLFDILEDEESKRIAYYKVAAWFMNNEELKALDYGEIYTKDEYVPTDIMSLKGKETIVDCGAFTGDTLEYFISDIGYIGFEKYICFELSKFNFEKLTERVSHLTEELKSRVQLINKGVADRSMKISYTGEISGTHISEVGETEGEITSLDEALGEEKVTYLKMDIEGCEVSALKGAEMLIKNNKPKCAICVYHQATDLWEIPILLKEMVPDYKLYLRHHQTVQTDTVCYAVV
ncbi:MAG: FkbM family methyltransferase [Anaerovoracaceae bacterium]